MGTIILALLFLFSLKKKKIDSCWSLYQADIFFLYLENVTDLFSITVLQYNVVLSQIENSTFCDLDIALCDIEIFIIFRLIAQPYFYNSPQTRATTLKTNLFYSFTKKYRKSEKQFSAVDDSKDVVEALEKSSGPWIKTYYGELS